MMECVGLLGLLGLCTGAWAAAGKPMVLKPDILRQYVEGFNADDEELYRQLVPNAQAYEFLRANVPLLECPDKELERTYYFRWWTFRKHLRETPDGFVVTEFLPDVPWAGKHNTIPCAAGHHLYEGRWLRDRRYLDDYSTFWFRRGGDPHRYSFWAADGVWARACATGDFALARNLLPDLVRSFHEWEKLRMDPNGLFWQNDGEDGMEVAIGGTGYRATIMSYMAGDAAAIARIAALDGKPDLARQFRERAESIKRLLLGTLWDKEAQFFKVGRRDPALGAKSTGILEWKVNGDAALTRSAKASASHCNPADTVSAMNDGREPANSGDQSLPRMTFWDHQGTQEWVQYDFPAPVTVSSVQVYWFQDGAGCAVPDAWRVLYRKAGVWEPVQAKGEYGRKTDAFNEVALAPVNTDGLRLEVSLRKGSASRGAIALADVREEHGYTPWYFDIPEPDKAVAWKQLLDPKGFLAPYGPTTAEQRHPRFALAYQGHECQWNGPSWPYSTAVTLTALANVLNGPRQDVVARADYLKLLRIYALSHHRQREDGRTVCWIDENLNPLTGDWISRTMLRARGQTNERGKDYNHSTFCDLVITGLVGLRPQPDDRVLVNPLVPAGRWDWFCLDGIPYHGRTLTILWDRTGQHYGKGEGLQVFADGRRVGMSNSLAKVEGRLPKR